jgi:thiol-disulfide isomerase/thioredoxin
MKKYFPLLIITALFSTIIIVQMLINGQRSNASKINSANEMYSVYEAEFQEFKHKTTDGTVIDLKTRKEPLIIVNFWASWCRPCIAEFKALNKLIEKYDESLFVVGINNDTDNALKEIKKVEEKYNLKFSSIENSSGSIAEKFNVSRIPATVVYFKGKVIQFSNTEFDFMSSKFTNLLDLKLKNIK